MNAMRNYKPRHETGCRCVVCTTAEFVATMRSRSEIRQKRVHAILNNPFGTRPDSGYWTEECGHVEEYTVDRAEGRETCVRCGAKFCGCECCNGLARVNLQLKIHELNDREG